MGGMLESSSWRDAVANCSTLFTELPLLRRPAAARLAGFAEVEFWWPFPSARPAPGEIDAFVDAVEAARVRVTGLNYFSGDRSAGQRGIMADPRRVAEFREGVRQAHRLGSRVGCQSFNVLVGRRTGDLLESRTARGNLRYALDRAEADDVSLLLEPLSDAADYPLRSVSDVRRAIEDAGSPARLGLLADVYHLTANGRRLDDVLEALDILRHVQIADFPGRGEPGSGALPLTEFLAELRARGYDGRVALEFLPRRSTADSLAALSAVSVPVANTSGGQ